MTWFRIDDQFGDHPKVIGLLTGKHFERALALWILCGTWSAKHLTDGAVPSTVVLRSGVTKGMEAAAELVRVGLWSEEKGQGFRFHSWADYQPSSESVKAKRAKIADRVRKHRDGVTPPVTRYNDVTDPLPPPEVSEVVTPPPSRSRPDPDKRESEDAPVASLEAALTGGEWKPYVEPLRSAIIDWAKRRGVPTPREAHLGNEGLVLMPLAKWLHELCAIKGWIRQSPKDLVAEDDNRRDRAKWLIQRFYSTKDARTVQNGYPLTWLARNPQQYTMKEGD